ncbi:MAG: hypothetical protein LV480_03580 [Methylacidiphilales bacterium]|nr:hypothetical protein [Candidatus Methylacidiphilales bacterium]
MHTLLGTTSQASPQAVESTAPWLVPGSGKEAWKSQGNHHDYRELKASRPADLEITISGPRQFSGV